MRRITLAAIGLMATFAFTACEPDLKTGCTDFNAKNYSMDAEQDCGCCEYEKVVFFSRFPGYTLNGIAYPLTAFPVKIYVNEQEVGTVTAFYPGGPGNSTVPGVVIHNPGNQKKVEWYARVSFPNGSFVILGSGTLNAGKNPLFVPIF